MNLKHPHMKWYSAIVKRILKGIILFLLPIVVILFLVEVEQHADGSSTVFFPEPPDAKSGELRLIPSSKLKKLNIPASKLIAITRKYGHGASLLNIGYKNNCM